MLHKILKTLSFPVALAIGFFTLVPVHEANALVCSSTFTVDASSGPVSLPDCSGTDNFFDILFAEHHMTFDPPFQGTDWVTDLHIRIHGADIESAQFNIPGFSIWNTEISGDMVWFTAPDFAQRLEPGVRFDWDVAWETILFDYVVTIEYTMDVVPEPATLAIFGLGLAGLGLMRRRKRAA